jgi:glycosyltransferase involved in cell wall biosynthesis
VQEGAQEGAQERLDDGVDEGLDDGDEEELQDGLDDGSDDETPYQLREYAKIYQNIEIANSYGRGLVAALNLGISLSRYGWIARFDADDHYPTDRLSRQRQYISDDVSAIFSDYQIVFAGHKNGGVIPSPIFPIATMVSLLKSQQTAHPSVLFNKERALAAGSYLESDFPAEDLGLWLRMASNGNLISVPETLLVYTLSQSSISASRRREILIKTKFLVSQSRDSMLKNLNENRYNISKEFYGYGSTKFGTERKLLFLRNLRQARAKKILLLNNRALGMPNQIMFSVLHFNSVLKIIYFTFRRRVFRKFRK